MYNAIESCSDLLLQFGGHKYAAGLTLKENLPAFIEKFEQVVSNIEEYADPRDWYSLEVAWEDITKRIEFFSKWLLWAFKQQTSLNAERGN